ncbi:hypothetical protein [Nocardia puris]|uniref:Uncharacterized protein n=1 Tax=Nocardia puris TaxID=208602 RepID=A0A366DR72_9NOCA|nr:hypothetical protein DFR74_103216 [Nocardia puris]
MGAYSTSAPLTAAAEAKQPARRESPAPSARTMSTPTLLIRSFAWLFFAGGLVGAVLGIAGLHVEITVAGLILACTAGLVLLKLRADAGASSESD